MLAAVVGCVDPNSTGVDVPGDVDFVAVLTFDATDALVASTPLTPVGGPVFSSPDVTTRLVGYAADAFGDTAPDGERLRPPESCDPALPPPAWYADWSGDTFTTLDPGAAPALALADGEPDCETGCRRFVTTTVRIDDTLTVGLATVGVRIDAETVLISGRDEGSSYLVSRDGTVTSTTIPIEGPVAGGFNAPDGTLWFVSVDGTVHSGRWGALERRLEGGFPPERPYRSRMVFDDRHDPDDLFAVTNDYFALRYDGRAWRSVSDYSGPLDLEIDATRDGDDAFVIGAAESILHVTDAGIQPAPLGSGGANSAAIVTNVPGFGVVAGTTFARLYRWEGAWTEFDEEPPLLGFPRVIIPFDDSFLVGGTSGVLTEYRFDAGYCEPIPLAPHRVQLFTDDADGLVLYGGGADMPFGVTFVEPASN